MRKTNKEMVIEGCKTRPQYVYANMYNVSNKEFVHDTPIKYELVFRGMFKQYLYVPIGDKCSSESRGGNWIWAFEGLSFESYADEYFFCHSSLEIAKQIQNIIEETKNNDKSIKNFIPNFIKYCVDNNINPIKFFPNFKTVLKDYCFSRRSINANLRPYYQLDEKNNIIPYNKMEIFYKKIDNMAKKIEILQNKIKKLNIKKSELQKSMHYFVLENTKG